VSFGGVDLSVELYKYILVSQRFYKDKKYF